MDGATLQTKVWGGYAKAAARVGLPHDLYRPNGASNPLAPGNKISTLQAAFTRHGSANFDFSQPSDHKNALFHALIDPTTLHVGDYLKPQSGVFGPFFIASMEPAKPVLAVQCNRTLSVFQPGPQNVALGQSGYGGTTIANETAMLTGWPASSLLGSRATRDQQLPGDAGYGSFRILLPVLPPGVVIRPGTIITDDLSNRMIVIAAELQDLGWRIDASQAIT